MNPLQSVAAVARRIGARLWVASSPEERNIRLLTVDTALGGIPNAGFNTFVPVFLARLGASSLAISALTAVPALLSLLVALPGSAWVERQRDHARTTAVLRAWFSAAWWLVVLAPSLVSGAGLTTAIVALWAAQAIPIAIATSSFTSVVGAVVPARRRPTVNGLRWALNSVVAGLAVAGFGWLLDAGWLTFPRNYQLVFLVSAIASIGNVVLFARIKFQRSTVDAPLLHQSLRQRAADMLRPVLGAPPFLRFLLVAVIMQLGVNMPVALYSIFWVRTLQASDTVIGLRTTVAQAAVIAGSLGFGRYVTRRGHLPALLISAVGLSLYPMLTAMSPNAWWLLPAAAVWGIFNGALNVSFFEAIVITAPAGKVPTFTAFYFVVISAANFIGPFIGSALAGCVGIEETFWICGAVLLGAALVCWRLNRHREPPAATPSP